MNNLKFPKTTILIGENGAGKTYHLEKEIIGGKEKNKDYFLIDEDFLLINNEGKKNKSIINDFIEYFKKLNITSLSIPWKKINFFDKKTEIKDEINKVQKEKDNLEKKFTDVIREGIKKNKYYPIITEIIESDSNCNVDNLNPFIKDLTVSWNETKSIFDSINKTNTANKTNPVYQYGKGNYFISLIFFIGDILSCLSDFVSKLKSSKLKLINSYEEIINEKIEKIHLIIDLPEKFLHPNLILKVAKSLKKISKTVDLTIITHSPLFLTEFIDFKCVKEQKQEIIYFRKNINESKKYENYKLKFEIENKNDFFLEFYLNKERIMNLFFVEKIILVEDMGTKFFIRLLIDSWEEEDLSSFYIFDCFGKSNIPKITNFLLKNEIKLENNFVIADKDKNSSNKEDHEKWNYEIKSLFEKEESNYFFFDKYIEHDLKFENNTNGNKIQFMVNQAKKKIAEFKNRNNDKNNDKNNVFRILKIISDQLKDFLTK